MSADEKQEACSKEINEVLKKYGFTLGVLPPRPVIVPVEEKKEEVKPPIVKP